MSTDTKRWIVKDQEGRIYGPFNTQKILRQIEKGYYSGEEQVADYPGGSWIPISKAPEFYDKLLDVLASEAKGRRAGHSVFDSDETFEGSVHSQDWTAQKTEKRGRVVRETVVPETPKAEPIQPPPKALGAEPAKPVESDNVIELTDLKALEREEKLKIARLPVILIAAALGLLGLAVWMSPAPTPTRIRLLAPRKNQPEIPDTKVRDKFKRALKAFQQDTVANYLLAQNELVQIVEGAPKNAEALSSLCLTYRELWPFATQDTNDFQAVHSITRHAKQVDPTGLDGAICEIVEMNLTGRFKEARGLTETWVQLRPTAAVLFDLRGEMFMTAKDFQTAASYFEKAHTLWPQWLKSYVQEARSRASLRQFKEAMNLYRAVLGASPNHAVAKIELGVIEHQQFQHGDKAFELIRTALDSGDKIPSSVEAMGFLALAEIYLHRNQKAKALDHARRAFELNTSSTAARQLLLRLEGADGLKKTKVEGRELIFRGDQYFKAGDYFAAQAEYKAAFEYDPTNAIAAMKAARCMWNLNQSGEAVDLLRRAIQADPNLTAAYVLLADYYSQRFDFMSAVRVLQKIQSIAPRNYEVYRGFALVELRRNNFKGTVTFAQKAIQLYDTDTETYIIMAQALYGLQNFQEAQKYISRAIEMDINNPEAQGLYAKILAGLQGADAGITYIQELINTYLYVVEYRMALAEILIEEERFAQAEDVLRQIMSLEPTNKKAFLTLGKVLQEQNRNQEALEIFLKAAVLDPSDANAIFQAGMLFYQTNKMNEALSQFQRVLKINPRYPRAHYQLGKTALQMGNPKLAMEEAENERAVNPDLADAYILAAEAQFAMGQYSACAAEYQKAVSKRATDTTIYVKMARCYRMSNALDSAISLLRQAQLRESGNPDIYKELGAVYRARGMNEEAIKSFQQYLLLVPNAPDRLEVETEMRKAEMGGN